MAKVAHIADEIKDRIEVSGGQIDNQTALLVAAQVINRARNEDPDEEADPWWVMDRISLEELQEMVKEVSKGHLNWWNS